MSTLFLLWRTSKLFRYAVYAATILAAAGAICGVIYHRGKNAGQDQQRQVTTALVETSHDADSTFTTTSIQDDNLKIAAALERAHKAESMAIQLAAIVAQAQQRQDAAAKKVSATPDAELHQLNVSTIGARAKDDTTPGYTAQEERVIANVLQQYPEVVKANQAQTEQLKKLTERVDALDAGTKLQDARFEKLAGYTGRLEGYYADLWNSYPHKYRSVKCLGLWRCGNRTIKAPPPDALRATK